LGFRGRSQPYIPMLNSYAEWHVTSCYFGCITDRYYTIGDTLISGYHYKFLDLYHYNKTFLLREDTAARRIYMRFIGGGPKPPGDQLLYDFKMQAGDSMDVVNPNSPYPSSSGKFVLDSIKLRPLVNKSYRYFYLRSLDTASSGVKNTVWVEGIGSLCLINTPGAPPNISGIGQLSCFFNNGIKEYEDLDSISSCTSIYPISVKEEIRFKNSISIRPNPAHSSITIGAKGYDLEGLRMEVINIFGETELTFDHPDAIDISQLSAGLYFIRFVKDERSYAIKFIRE
jgi:hypothetical protein